MILDTGAIRINIAPEQGGKILEIYDHQLGRNLLADSQPDNGLPFSDGAVFSVAGWDEAVPTVAASCGVPDLGYAWRTEAVCQIADSKLITSWNIPGWTVERQIRIEGRNLSASYAITNLREEPAPILWAGHALFSLIGVNSIKLPAGELVPGPGCILKELTSRLDGDVSGWQIDQIANLRTSWKFFLPAKHPVTLRLDNATVEITTDASWWGIWLNEGHVGPLCIGIEPTNAPSDAMADSDTIIEGAGVFRASWHLQIK